MKNSKWKYKMKGKRNVFFFSFDVFSLRFNCRFDISFLFNVGSVMMATVQSSKFDSGSPYSSPVDDWTHIKDEKTHFNLTFTRLKLHHVKQCKYRIDFVPRLGWKQDHHKSETCICQRQAATATVVIVAVAPSAPPMSTSEQRARQKKGRPHFATNGCDDDDVSWVYKIPIETLSVFFHKTNSPHTQHNVYNVSNSQKWPTYDVATDLLIQLNQGTQRQMWKNTHTKWYIMGIYVKFMHIASS